jgi:hypothetical protein
MTIRALFLGAALLAPLPALAQADASALIVTDGLAAAEEALTALPDPTPSDHLALGGVRFLRGVERALQLRWRVGMAGGVPETLGLPLLRLPVPENPAPEPFAPAMIEDLLLGVEADMAGAIEALAEVGEADAALLLPLGEVWLDIDGNGARGEGEGLLEVAGWAVSGGFGEELPDVTVRFDTADAAWLSAYAHLLSGLAETGLALDPTAAVARVVEGNRAMAALPRPAPDPYGYGLQSFAPTIDGIAMLIHAVEGRPDPERLLAARDHALAVVEENRRFWRLVARERDDDREWIPSKSQVSATGLPFPPDTGARWLAVLAEGEAVLRGERLIPFWRLGEGAGIDLAALIADPPEISVAGLIQGHDLAPYMREGPRARADALRSFAALVGGNAPLYAVMLN